MAEEAVIEQEPEVAEATPEPSPYEAALARFDSLRAGVDPDAETEQTNSDEPAADVDPVEEEVTSDVDQFGDGPSFLMKRAALDAGLDESLVAKAKDDATLELLIETAGKARQTEAKPEEARVADFALPVNLPEDEFGPDDPIRKMFVEWSAALKDEISEARKGLGMLAQHANRQLEQAEQSQQAEVYSKLSKPFDTFLDSFDSDVLGNSKKPSPKMIAERSAIWDKYLALGVDPSMSEEDMTLYVELAATAHSKALVEQRNKKRQAAESQPSKVIGGGGNTKSVDRPLTLEEKMQRHDDIRMGKIPRPADY